MARDFSDPKKPTHLLKILVKETDRSGTVGAAWENPDGSFRVRLDPGVVLSWKDLEGCLLTLFPNDRNEGR